MAALVAAAFLGAVVGGLWVGREDPSRSGGAGSVISVAVDSDGEVQSLHELLAVEMAARAQLAGEVAGLRARLDSLVEDGGVAMDAEGDSHASTFPDGERPGQLDSVTEARKTDAERLREAQGGAFDREALIQAGVRPDEVEGLRELWEQSEMDKLYLSDAAARDGWLPSRRYREELRTLNEEFRQELGDDSYDQLLFATGRPNRVVVQDVLEDSPADYAGLQAGDAIVSYDEMRVFRPGELKLATSGGRRGELVPVSVIRGDQRMIVYVERGPLGVIIQTERRSPVADG